MIQISDYCLFTWLGSILLAAAVIDIHAQRIPNLLTYPAAVLAIVFHCITNGVSGLLFSLAGLAAGLVLLLLPYLSGGMGAGDAKLMGAVGATIGPQGVFYAFLCTAVVGGIYALIIAVIYRRQFKGVLKNLGFTLVTCISMRKYIPNPGSTDQSRPKLCYGLAIAFGTSIYLVLKMTKPDIFIL